MSGRYDSISRTRIFITGHNGFVGSWLTQALSLKGAILHGYSLPLPPLNMYSYLGEMKNVNQTIDTILNRERLNKAMEQFKPELVIHLAAQPIVIDAFNSPIPTVETNVMGTVNVLEAIRKTPSVQGAIVFTSDKVYRNNEIGKTFEENDPLGGYDPYSASKSCADIMTTAYRKSFFESRKIGIGVIRAGNIVGGGDWAKYRLIPDLVNSIIGGKSIELRYPQSTRPWQHVLDAVHGIMTLAMLLLSEPDSYSNDYNMGSELSGRTSVGDLVETFIKRWGAGGISYTKPTVPEALNLQLDFDKMKKELHWHGIYGKDELIEKTVEWYKMWAKNREVKKITISQILEYEDLELRRSIA